MKKITTYLKQEVVLSISCLLAIISMFIVAPSKSYIEYIDFRTLSLLLCLMLVMAGLRNLGVFKLLGHVLLQKTSNTRQMAFVLVFLCFFSSMFITNDVALITFVPFTLEILLLSKEHSLSIPIIVLQTIAANLGSMLTPLGNPQNLYLYSLSDMSVASFIGVMLPFTVISFILLVISCFFIQKRPIQQNTAESQSITSKHLVILYLCLFVVCLTCVFRILPYPFLLLITILVLGLADRKNILRADYALLCTFIFLFIFIGNLSHIEVVNHFLQDFILGRELLSGVFASQFISNVPAAILLSGFTTDYHALLIGVNIGGLGTLIASMASLISFKLFSASYATQKGKYLGLFTLLNIGFLIVLYIFALFI